MSVRWIVAAGFCSVLAAGTASAQDPKLVERGQTLYAEQKCGMCHSIGGKGSANALKGPIDDAGTKFTAEELRQWLINPKEMSAKHNATRKPPMPSYAKLSKEDVEALVAYMQTLKKK